MILVLLENIYQHKGPYVLGSEWVDTSKDLEALGYVSLIWVNRPVLGWSGSMFINQNSQWVGANGISVKTDLFLAAEITFEGLWYRWISKE